MNTAVVIITGSSVAGSMVFFLFLSRGGLLLLFLLGLVGAFPSHMVVLSAVDA